MARKQARQAAVKPADTAPPPPKGDAPSAEPAFEPDTTWEGTAWVMLCIIYGSWFLLLAAGARAYEGEPVRVKPHQLPLYQFDQMFRAAGGAFIFGMWALRACATYMLPRADHTATLWVPLALHAALGALRLAVYRAHAAGLIFAASRWAAPAPSGHVAHVMSDHILLAAAAVGGLAVEAAMPLLSVRGARGAADVKSMRSYAKLATAMAVVLGWECYYTARYFHPPSEILVGAAVGLVFFQAPLLLFTVRAIQAAAREERAAAEARSSAGRPEPTLGTSNESKEL